jgi:hypothetical protein
MKSLRDDVLERGGKGEEIYFGYMHFIEED